MMKRFFCIYTHSTRLTGYDHTTYLYASLVNVTNYYIFQLSRTVRTLGI